MIPAIATLVVGVLIGYLGQRSRFCTVSGIRDYLLRKDTHRLRGLLGLIIGGVLGFSIFKLIGGDVPNFPMPIQVGSVGLVIAAVIGGLGLGFYSVLAEGCPFRQHVMAAEGRESAMFYLLGFYIGVAYFFTVTAKWLELLLRVTS
jgi:hypothetical protein